MKSEIVLRKGRPSDIAEVLPPLYSSGPATWEYLFGTPQVSAREFLRHAFERDAGFVGSGVFTVAVIGGRVAGVGAFYSGREMPWLTARTLARILAFYGPVAGAGVIARLTRLTQLSPAPSRDTHFVTCLGVSPDMQGRGVGSALLRHEMETARALGRRRLGLDVALDNPNAERLYARLGFEVARERHPGGALEGRLPGLRRMYLGLST